MSNAVYVRFNDYELNFIEKMAKEDSVTRSETIKKLVSYALKKIRIDKAINNYKEGKLTIREAAETAGLRYFEFFDLLARENLIGTSPENINLMLKNII